MKKLSIATDRKADRATGGARPKQIVKKAAATKGDTNSTHIISERPQLVTHTIYIQMQ